MSDDFEWTDEDSAKVLFEALSDDHPSRVAREFSYQFHYGSAPDVLAQFVTPEGLAGWGDFSVARSFFLDQALAVATRSLRHEGAHDVAYVKLVPDNGSYLTPSPRQDVLAWVVLVWRPELGGWRIHSVGQPVPPSMLPRSALTGVVPVSDVDQEVTLEHDQGGHEPL